MKKGIRVVLVFAVLAAAVFTARAQSPKFGHINSAELLGMMSEIKDADKALQAYGAQLESQLKTMTDEYQAKVKDYQSKESLMADAIKQSKVKEITDLEARIQEFQQTAQQSAEKKKEELYSPILKKAENAIIDIAKENGYAYIFDTSVGAVIYGQDSDNIMELAKKKLGITATGTPATTPVNK